MRPDLRQYQTDAVNELRAGFASGVLRQVLVAPTGSGKSVMAHEIVARAREKGKRVLFVVNRIQLVNQFSRRLLQAGITHGIVRGEDTRAPHSPVVVASIQTIARRGVDPFDVIVIDEAHAVPGSKDYRKLLAAHPNAAVLGLTATPWAKGMAKEFDDIGILFQRAVVAAKYSELIEQGHLVDCDVWAPSEPDMKGAQTVRNAFGDLDYSDKAAAERMDKPQITGDILKHWIKIAPNTNTVIFASSIDHSKNIVAAFRGAGYPAEHISAYTPLDEREAIFARHASGETKILSCVALLREGWDAPECETMILARPTRSVTAYIQMAGRVLRPAPGKPKAVLIDHTGTAKKLGFPTEDRDMTLDDGKPRVTVAERAPLKPCPACGYIDHYRGITHNVKGCFACGFIAKHKPKEVEVADGVLQRLKKGQASREDKQRLWGELLFIADERGYSHGWASHKYRSKTGVWPRGLDDIPVQPTPATRGWIKSEQIRWAKSQERARMDEAERRVFKQAVEAAEAAA